MTDIALRPQTATSRRALEGIRVVESGFAAAGPLVGKYLANFGAEVIRLESRFAPDVFRSTYPPFKDNRPGPDRAAMFAFYNDGKRSATLNLKHPRGVELARRLILTADVFIESFTPGTVARLGLGAETLRPAPPPRALLAPCSGKAQHVLHDTRLHVTVQRDAHVVDDRAVRKQLHVLQRAPDAELGSLPGKTT